MNALDNGLLGLQRGYLSVTNAASTTNPCRIFFKMPSGEGTYALRGSAFPIGEYPAGNTAMIGSFFESRLIQVVGTDLPKT